MNVVSAYKNNVNVRCYTSSWFMNHLFPFLGSIW